MPELPEVEVTRRTINDALVGDRIESVELCTGRLRRSIDSAGLASCAGKTVRSTGRRGKHLLIHLSDGRCLLIHLGMSGSLRYTGPDHAGCCHEHIIWRLGGGCLVFRDPRRFGMVELVNGEELATHRTLSNLGPEPFDRGLLATHFIRLKQGRTLPVKHFIMDQRVVAGVGNIYASEALFRAGIHPTRRLHRIANRRLEVLAAEIAATIEDSIAHGATTLQDFRDGRGDPGRYQVRLQVYDRAGQPCQTCGTGIQRIVQAGRSTYFCPACQR
ncbi:bifunctional DNA-formamidopyrimidine glycosylase/DNA-(apurinic or apyrimidinic site) lyase [bacterium]|nr:bifunctional DNA-formamidopyrimidine glycosylase/DNA-(apurinic or apyrimidinic site) lyase [candidate division CSSED10-310 bacterium]